LILNSGDIHARHPQQAVYSNEGTIFKQTIQYQLSQKLNQKIWSVFIRRPANFSHFIHSFIHSFNQSTSKRENSPSVDAAASFQKRDFLAEPTGIVLAATRRNICTFLAGKALDNHEGTTLKQTI